MVGREKELSIHFVPGDCRLVEVRESALGSHGSQGRTGEQNQSQRLAWCFLRVVPESEPRRRLPGPETGAAPRSLFISVHTQRRCLSQLPRRETSKSGFTSPLSQERRGAFQSCFTFDSVLIVLCWYPLILPVCISEEKGASGFQK